MRESTSWRLAAIATAAATIVGLETTASAASDDREQCAASAESAQQLRDEGKYRRAREQMLVCARDVCPGPIKSDCGKWLTEVDRDAPTVVFGAKSDKGDLSDVKVSMDGAVVQERLDGKPLIVDSGEHTFKFETKDGAVREEKVLLRAAEKARSISVSFGTAPVVGGDGHPSGEAKEGSIVPAIIVGGIGVLAIGSFAIFGLAGKGAVDDLESSHCKPNCSQADVDSARTKLIIADISLGVGVVALGVATYMFLTRSKAEAKTGARAGTWWKLDGGPVPGGGVAGLSAKF